MKKKKTGLLAVFLHLLLITIISCTPKQEVNNNQTTGNASLSEKSDVTANTEGNLTEFNNTAQEKSVEESRKSKLPEGAHFISEEDDTAIYKKDGLILTEGILAGQFIEIQRGDYLHLILKDTLNIYHSFFILLENKKRMDELWMEENYPEYESKIRVHWKRQRIQLIDTDARMTIYSAVKIEQEL